MFSIAQRAAVLVAVIALSGLAVACGSGAAGGTSATSTPATQATAPARALTIVALGDSETTGHGDPSGLGWVERYARLVRKQFHTRVVVSNLAEDGTTSDQLLDEVRHDAATRREIQRAGIVLLGIGGADLNAGDD